MRIIGIDPGIALMGFGIIDIKGNELIYRSHGVIESGPDLSIPNRLSKIDRELEQILEITKPDEAAFEELFFYNNKRTAFIVAQARGVEVTAFAKKDIPLFEYTPAQIKQAVTGYGRATKKQIQETVQILLKLKEIPKPDDAADGLAVAICHAFNQRFKEKQRMT